MLKYHIIKITYTVDRIPIASRVLTPSPLKHKNAVHWFLLELILAMKWPVELIDKINLDIKPTYTDVDELPAVNWNPLLLSHESQLRWAMWKMQIDYRYTVPGHEPNDDYGIQTYILAVATPKQTTIQ